MTAAIEVRGLTMSYGDRQVLLGIDFEVSPGEVFCLLGPNAAGKTTTVEILEGLRQRTGGTVSVLGMDPQAQSARLRERVGIVLQECGFPRQARVAELIDSWRAYYRKPRALADLLHVVELTEEDEEPDAAHIVTQKDLIESQISGKPIRALCGKLWVPKRNPDNYPMCQACVEVLNRSGSRSA